MSSDSEKALSVKSHNWLVWEDSTVNYFESTEVTVNRFCNGITVTNIGGDPVTVNGILLFPSLTPATVAGDSISLGGNENEIYSKGRIRLSFAGTGANPQVQVTQKYYLIKD